jgi:hypothetical protein
MEGPTDNNTVSWRLKPLADWPFVMITSPADKRLITSRAAAPQVMSGEWQSKGRRGTAEGCFADMWPSVNGKLILNGWHFSAPGEEQTKTGENGR